MILAVIGVVAAIVFVLGMILAVAAGFQAYGRYQRLADERNQIQVNDIQIAQTEQLVKVEQQRAQIRIADAQGVAQAQQIINQTLTPLYLQHEAIQAETQMVNSPNHTVIYIPVGNNGIPIVSTVDPQAAANNK